MLQERQQESKKQPMKRNFFIVLVQADKYLYSTFLKIFETLEEIKLGKK